MVIGRSPFNIYLLLLLAGGLAGGCGSLGGKSKKPEATLRLHLEVIPESMDFSTTVPIYRA